jgi:hypothetical protein
VRKGGSNQRFGWQQKVLDALMVANRLRKPLVQPAVAPLSAAFAHRGREVPPLLVGITFVAVQQLLVAVFQQEIGTGSSCRVQFCFPAPSTAQQSLVTHLHQLAGVTFTSPADIAAYT